MQSFARATKLPDLSGRADYISNPKRQERIVAASEKVDWSEYQEYERTHQKKDVPNNQGREMIIMLPNEWSNLPADELHRRGDALALAVAGKDHERQWAMHWNKEHSNFHIHIIYSERQREKNPGRWDRDIYLTQDGKVARRKADRATNEDGSMKPPVHRKGDLKDGFTAKDPKFATRSWLHETKQALKSLMAETWGVKFDKQAYLPEFHEGKGKEAPVIRQKNEVTRENNRRLGFLEKHGYGHRISALVAEAKAIRAEKKNPVIFRDSDGEIKVAAFTRPLQALRKLEITGDFFVDAPTKKAPEMPLTTPEKPQKAPERENATIPAQQPEKAPEKPQKAPERPKEAEPERQRVYQPQETKADKLRDAYAALRAARAKENDARTEFHAADKLPFWESTKKPRKAAAISKLREAESEGQAAFSSMTELGISKFSDGVELRYSLLSDDDIRSLSQKVDRKIEDWERKEAHETANAARNRSLSPEQIKAVALEGLEQSERNPVRSRKSKKDDRAD